MEVGVIQARGYAAAGEIELLSISFDLQLREFLD
jgi:hypothetical protein